MSNVTIIIPTYNEEHKIGRLVEYLLTNGAGKNDIIVVDGGSTDSTLSILSDLSIRVLSGPRSRSIQMNMAVEKVTTNWLYFVHADTEPIESWRDDLNHLIAKNLEGGTYRSQFVKGPFMLNLNSFFTRFNWLVSRGGDQTLFIKRSVFNELNGFDEKMVVMEEYPIIKKLYERGKFMLFPSYTKICTRKYENNSWLKVSRANYMAFRMFKKGAPTEEIKKRYNQLLD